MGQFSTFMNEKKEQNLLLEAGFSRLAQIMAGLVPSVKSFAVVTWENPLGKQQTDEYNEKKTAELRGELKRGNYGHRQIKGKYGSLENPFFIMNISRDDARILGKRGDQESIIWGKVNGEFDVTFQLIYCNTNEVLERRVWKSLEKSTGNFYSEYKGRKFYIPFFDDEYKEAKFQKGKIVKEDYNIFFAEDFDEKIITEAENAMKEADIFNESVTGKHKWLHRGFAFNILSKAKKA